MPPNGHWIRQWRYYRDRMSLAALAQRMEALPGEEYLTSVSLGRIERGEQPLTIKTLTLIARALDADPIDVLTVNPLTQHGEMALNNAVRKLPAGQLETARKLIEAIAN